MKEAGRLDSSEEERGALLVALARDAVAEALGAAPSPADAPWLADPGATFVTLTRGGELRGCVGTLEATRPLREDVRRNAVGAAFHDQRFPPLGREELDGVRVEVSELSAPERLAFAAEADVLACLRPGTDGVILRHGVRRSTFLPQVWDQLPEPADFLGQLKRKAGLSPGFWARDIEISRYGVRKWRERGRGADA